MSKNIVIPVDFSANTRNTIQYGIFLADELNLDVELVHVIHVDYPSYGQINPVETISYPPNIEEQKNAARKKFDDILKELDYSKPRDVNIKDSIRPGFYVSVVAAESNKESTEFLLLTGQGKEDKVPGIAAESIDVIVEGSSSPVIVVSPQAEFKKIKRILYATDFQEEDIDSLKELSAFGRRFDAEIMAMHITDNPDFKERMKEKGFSEIVSEKVGYKHIKVISMPSEKVAKGIAENAENMYADMIALLKENEGFWKNLFSKSTTEKLIKETDLPIIVFNQPNKE